MGHRREYEIAFAGLKPGVHEFSYEISDAFFEPFQQQDFSGCLARIKLTLDKKPGFLLLKFEVGGSLNVICDRCNATLPLELWEEFNIIVKLVEDPALMNEQEDDPDIYYISHGESHIDISGWVYEFINLSIPMHKVCAFEKMDGPYCNPQAREALKRIEKENGLRDNLIWKDLEKFRNKEN